MTTMARARNTDPTSSHQAADSMNANGTVLKQQTRWLVALAEYIHATRKPDATRAELAHWFARRKWGGTDIDEQRIVENLIEGEFFRSRAQIGRRFPEMAEEGLITKTGQRPCSVAEQQCQAWTLTSIGAHAAKAITRGTA